MSLPITSPAPAIPDPKIGELAARGVPGGGAAEPGGMGSGSGRGFEGDLVAQGFELADVAALAAFGADAGVVEVAAEVVVAGAGVGEQVR